MFKLNKEQYDNLDDILKEYLVPSNLDFETSKETHPELYRAPSAEAASLLISAKLNQYNAMDFDELEEYDKETDPREIVIDKRAFQMLESLRKKHKYTIKNLMDLLKDDHGIKISQPAITKWEKQGNAPREEIQDALASIYNFNSRNELLEFLMDSYRVKPVIAKIKQANIENYGKKSGLEINRLIDRNNELEQQLEVRRIKLFKNPVDINGCNLLSSGTLISKEHDWITAPSVIENTNGCFAIMIVNDEMSARYMEGDIIFLDIRAPVSIGDDVALVLRYPDEDKMVAVCRTMSEFVGGPPEENDEEQRSFGHFGLASQKMYYEAHIEAEREFIERQYEGEKIDPSKSFEEYIKRNTLSLGIWEDYQVQGMSNTGGRKMIIGNHSGYENRDIIPETAAIYKVVCSYRKTIETNLESRPNDFVDFGDFSGIEKFT